MSFKNTYRTKCKHCHPWHCECKIREKTEGEEGTKTVAGSMQVNQNPILLSGWSRDNGSRGWEKGGWSTSFWFTKGRMRRPQNGDITALQRRERVEKEPNCCLRGRASYKALCRWTQNSEHLCRDQVWLLTALNAEVVRGWRHSDRGGGLYNINLSTPSTSCVNHAHELLKMLKTASKATHA
jgi:hypothetical protein